MTYGSREKYERHKLTLLLFTSVQNTKLVLNGMRYVVFGMGKYNREPNRKYRELEPKEPKLRKSVPVSQDLK